MRVISFEQADHLLSWKEISQALLEGHQLSKATIGDLLLQSEPNALLNRGAWIPELGMAMKSMSVFPENINRTPPLPTINGGVLLFDGQTGTVSAIIDGILVTKWKTAGDSVLGAKLLANPNPKTHLMVGSGTVAKSIIEAYREMFPTIERFLIWSRTPENAQRLAAQFDFSVECHGELETAISQADIITTATMTKNPILKGKWIKPGTHVDLIGAFKPDMREADDALLQQAEVYVDSFETTIGHIGEIEIPLQTGALTREDLLGDLYDLCNDRAKRSSKSAITVFKNGGGAHLDLMTSHYIASKI